MLRTFKMPLVVTNFMQNGFRMKSYDDDDELGVSF